MTSAAQVTRAHFEDYQPWLAARSGQNKPRLTPATIARRLGTLRMFFIRIDEWGWDVELAHRALGAETLLHARAPVLESDLALGGSSTLSTCLAPSAASRLPAAAPRWS